MMNTMATVADIDFNPLDSLVRKRRPAEWMWLTLVWEPGFFMISCSLILLMESGFEGADSISGS